MYVSGRAAARLRLAMPSSAWYPVHAACER
jgi:hypothetical protein